MSYTIRQAFPNELESILGVVRKAFHADPYLDLIHWRAQENIEENKSTSFVALENGKYVGYAAIKWPYNMQRWLAYFCLLSVDPTKQGKGIGQALTAARIAYLKQIQFYGTAIADAVTEHTGSQKTLHRNGFYPTGMNVVPHFHDHDNVRATVQFTRAFPYQKLEPFPVYLPEKFRRAADRIMQPFLPLEFQETTKSLPSGLFLKQYVGDDEIFSVPLSCYPATLDRDFAPATIDYLLKHENRHYCAGFSLRIENHTYVFADMRKIPSKGIDPITVIPQANHVVDFVMHQL